MELRVATYSLDGYSRTRDLVIEIAFSDDLKIPEHAINKALMIAMNYLIENMETDKEESAE